jgi:translocation and assembly module TamB
MSGPKVPIRSKRKRRRLAQITAGICALTIVVVLAMPLWLPWLLTPGLRAAGVEVGAYERLGYGRFALREVRFANDNLIFTADRVETLQPLSWASRFAGFSGVDRAGFGHERPERMPIEVDEWRLELPLAGPPAEEPGLTSLTEALNLARMTMNHVSRLRPGLDLRRGSIHYQDEVLEVRRVVGGLDRIELELDSERLEEPLMIEFGWLADSELGTRFSLNAATKLLGEPLSSSTTLTQPPTEPGWNLAGAGDWGGNDWRYEGVFGPDDWWPAGLTLNAAGWEVPLTPWDIPGYRTLEGGARLSWADEALAFAMNWRAVPLDDPVPQATGFDPGDLAFPPVSVEVSGTVSFTRAVLDRLSVDSPGLMIELDRPIEVELTTQTLEQPGGVEFAVRLEEFGLLGALVANITDGFPIDTNATPLQGTISGNLEVLPNPEGWPVTVLRLRSTGVEWAHWRADTFELEADLGWPEARLSVFQLDLADGTTLSVEGRARIPEPRLEVFNLRLGIAPETLGPLLPETIDFERIILDVAAEGEITPGLDRLLSTGRLEATKLTLPSVQPLEPILVEWAPATVPPDPDARSEHRWQVGLGAAESTIAVAGAFRFALDEGWFEVPIESFLWQPGSGPDEVALPAVKLQEPVALVLREEPATANDADPVWTLMLQEAIVRADAVVEGDEIRSAGESNDLPSARVSVDITWPLRGQLELDLDQWNARWLRDWLVLPEWDETVAPLVWDASLHQLLLVAGWDGGPLDYQLETGIHVPHPFLLLADTTDTLRVNAQLAGSADMETLATVRIEDSGGAWFEASCTLPLIVMPGDTTQPIRWDPDASIEFQGTLPRRDELSVAVPKLGRLDLNGLTAQIQAHGSLVDPAGGIQVGFERLTLTPLAEEAGDELPSITDLQVDLSWGQDAITLETFELMLAGQPIELAGTLPLAAGFWAGLPGSIDRIDLAASHGRVKVGPIQLDALRPFLPPQLRAQGEIDVDAHWEAGFQIGGALVLSGLATHPLPASGAVQEIQGRIELEGSAVRMTKIRANLGGRWIGIDGSLDLEPTLLAITQQPPASIEDLFKLPLPVWDIAITADRIPVVRRPGMVIRTGLDIQTTHDGTSPPLIAGTVTPQESVFITDVRTMVPRGPATPMPRPPFVRIDHPLVGDWRLKIAVQGDEFLRVRSPVFRGVVSVGMTVSGELREPVLVGDVMIADGQLQFPFGNLRVTQGLVSLSEVDPTTLTVLVNASSRVYGYQITMNVSGTAESPAVVFSSNPPLNSEAIILMLTAGQLPQDELTFTAQQRATALASYLGKTLIDSWALEEPGEERLLIRSGESISVGGRSTYHLEYLLFDRWSLVGEYDEYDAMNAGVKYRLLYR